MSWFYSFSLFRTASLPTAKHRATWGPSKRELAELLGAELKNLVTVMLTLSASYLYLTSGVDVPHGIQLSVLERMWASPHYNFNLWVYFQL